ncbi:hypothetical protein H0H87_012453 [Tephrocybe sp. NHM501043]|nr:hypothetical protein H0H87_012453 [Tephrocybe sp. NHM501043]
MEFTQVEVAVRSLYADKFEKITDLTLEMKEQARQEALKRRQATSSHGSPLRSPARSPEPVEFSPLEQDRDHATTLPDAMSKRKRNSISPEGDDRILTDRPAKRTRVETPSSRTTPSLPSLHPLLTNCCVKVPPLPLSPPQIQRHHLLSAGNDVSLMLTAKALPSDRVTSLPGHDYKQYWTLYLYPLTFDPLDDPLAKESLAAQSPAPQGTDLVTTVVGDDTFSNGLDISTNTFDYNELFDDYEQPPLPSQGVQICKEFGYQIPDALPVSQSAFSEFPFLTNLPAISYTPAYDPLPVIDATHPTLLDSSANIDWNFSAFGSLEVEDSFGAVDLLPNFSGGNLFQRVTPFLQTGLLPVASLGVQVSKESGRAAIQMQLAAMKEKIQREGYRNYQSVRASQLDAHKALNGPVNESWIDVASSRVSAATTSSWESYGFIDMEYRSSFNKVALGFTGVEGPLDDDDDRMDEMDDRREVVSDADDGERIVGNDGFEGFGKFSEA